MMSSFKIALERFGREHLRLKMEINVDAGTVYLSTERNTTPTVGTNNPLNQPQRQQQRQQQKHQQPLLSQEQYITLGIIVALGERLLTRLSPTPSKINADA